MSERDIIDVSVEERTDGLRVYAVREPGRSTHQRKLGRPCPSCSNVLLVGDVHRCGDSERGCEADMQGTEWLLRAWGGSAPSFVSLRIGTSDSTPRG